MGGSVLVLTTAVMAACLGVALAKTEASFAGVAIQKNTENRLDHHGDL